jgi:hypothetical protein
LGQADPDRVKARLQAYQAAGPFIALVIGPTPYYRTLNNARFAYWSDAQFRAAITEIEGRFLTHGFAVTITLAGDGYGDREYKGTLQTDSLTRTHWRP